MSESGFSPETAYTRPTESLTKPKQMVFEKGSKEPLSGDEIKTLTDELHQAFLSLTSENPDLSGLLVVGSAATLYEEPHREKGVRMTHGSDLEVIPVTVSEISDPLERSALAEQIAQQLKQKLEDNGVNIAVEAFYPSLYGDGEKLHTMISEITTSLGRSESHLLSRDLPPENQTTTNITP